MIAPNVMIIAFAHGLAGRTRPMVQQVNTVAPVVIEDDVWIDANVTIDKGVRIGHGSVIGANSFVNVNVAPFSMMVGVPARLVRER